MKTLVLLSTLLFTSAVFAQNYQFPQPRTMGVAKVPVIYVGSKMMKMRSQGGNEFFRTVAILKWGVNVFERGQLIYSCKPGKVRCEAVSFKAEASYQACKVSPQGARCANKLAPSGNVNPDNYYRDNRGAPVFQERGDHHLDAPYSRDRYYWEDRRDALH